MDKQQVLEKVEEMKATVEQMRIDDIEEYPDWAEEEFSCDCCGEVKTMAGSLPYGEYRLCNDCVLLAETGLALKKMDSIEDLMAKMEDKRFETLYHSLFPEDENINN